MTKRKKTEVAQIILAEREKRGWTQAYLAARAGMDRVVLSNIERSHTQSPRLQTLSRIARALSVPLRELIPI